MIKKLKEYEDIDSNEYKTSDTGIKDKNDTLKISNAN